MDTFKQSKELFINMTPRDIPKWDARKQLWEQNPSTIQFYLNEYDKIKNGINLGGYQMSGWMYFHINFFKTNIINPNTLSKSIMTAPLDDNTYYLMECYKEAVRDGLGFCMWGTRGFAKSTFIGSMKHWTHLTKDGTSMLVYKEGNDLSSIRDMVTTSMSNIHPAFKLNILRGSGDWKDADVVFGNSLQNNEEFIKSQLRIINADGGAEKASEKGAGLTPIGYVMDEALAFDSILHSREKEITMEEVSIGDEIYGDDGELTTVLDKIDVGVVPMYEFTLSDGRTVESSADHVWRVKDKRYKKEVDLRTSDIVAKYKSEKFDSRYNKSSTFYYFSLPLCEPVNYPEKDLPLEPYFMGLFLGDGISLVPAVCSIDDEIKEYLKDYANRLGCDYSEGFHKHIENFSTIRIKGLKGVNGKGNNPVINALKSLNVRSNKHIPEIYLKGSVEQRLDLLRGLLDSDGHRTEGGNIEFVSTIPALAETFKKLVHSLGIRVKIVEREPNDFILKNGTVGRRKMATRFYLLTDLEVFKLTRKLSKKVYKGAKRKHNIDYVNIVDVKEKEPKQAYCIKASNKSSLFLVNQYITTHNCGKYNGIPILESAKVSFKYQNKSLFTYILAGCVCAGTKIWTNDGKAINIEDLNPEEGILGFDVENNKISKEKITYWQPPNEKPCYRITTNRGRILECSDDHPIYVRDKYENGVLRRNKYLFKEAKGLVKGDQVCVSGAFDNTMFGDNDMFDPYLIGMLVGDGTYSKTNSAKLFNADKEVLDYVKNKYKTSTFYSAPTKDGRTLEKLTISGITDELRKLGIKDQARETKTLPMDLHTYKREDILDMLAGLYDADGCVFIGKKIEKTKQKQGTIQEMVIKLTSCNRTILEEVRLVLQKFGIQANLVYEPLTENSSAKSTRGHYNLLIKSRSNLLKFAKLVPMRIGYKKENLKTIVDILTPLVKEDKNNFEHESIKSVEYIGVKPVYNLTAGTTHTYIANGIITHNTGGNETLSEGAKTMLCNPKDYDLLVMNWDLLNNMVPDEHITWKEDIGRKFGIFVPGQMSYRENEPKLLKTFGEFTKNQFKSEELNNLPINVTDWKATKEAFQFRLDNASDESVKTKQRMYYPMCIDDSFLTSKVNPFNAEAITKKLRELKENPKYTLVDIEVNHKDNKIETTFQTDKPIAERGYKKNISAPFMIFDGFPKEIPPKYKFVSGADDYKSADATTESLGSIYVLERRTLNMPLERIVACLVERPTTHREMHSKWEKLIRSTQAICNLEAADMSFVSYLEDIIKVDAYQYLHPFINPHGDLSTKKKSTTNSNYKFGTYPHQWNVKILFETVIQYTQQTFTVGFNPETNLPIVNTGIDLIDDPMLLQEMLDFKFGSGNYDRIFSFGWALLLARHMDSKNIMPEDQHVEKYNRDMFAQKRTKHSNFSKSKAKNF